jgi:hypothetical protein
MEKARGETGMTANERFRIDVDEETYECLCCNAEGSLKQTVAKMAMRDRMLSEVVESINEGRSDDKQITIDDLCFTLNYHRGKPVIILSDIIRIKDIYEAMRKTWSWVG